MADFYVSPATQSALGIKGRARKTPRSLLGLEETPEEQELRLARTANLTGAQTAGVGADIAKARSNALGRAAGLNFNRQELESTLVGQAEQETQLAKERLARQYGIDPGGGGSGASQRQFEELESGLIGTRANIRTSLIQQEQEANRANLAALNATAAQYGGMDLEQQAQSLAAAQAAGEALDQEDQLFLSAWQAVNQQGIQERQQALAETVQTGELALAGRAQTQAEQQQAWQQGETVAARNQAANLQQQSIDLQKQIEYADRTGDIQGRQTLQGQKQQVDIQLAQAQQKLAETEQTTRLGLAGRAQTLAEQQEANRKSEAAAALNLEQQRLNLEQQAANLQETIAKAEATGIFQGSPTLQKAMQDAQIAFQKAALTGTLVLDQKAWTTLQSTLQTAQLALEESQATGMYRAPGAAAAVSTLAKQLQDATISLDQTRTAMEAQQFLTTATGRVAGTGQVTAQDLGVDLTNARNPDGTWNADVYQRLGAAMEAAGVPLSQANLTSLLQGRSITTGQTTLAARELGATTASQMAAQQLQQQSLDLQTRIEEADRTGDLRGKATLQAQKQNIDAELARTQLAMQGQQFLTTATGRVGGTGQVTAQDLGVDLTGARKPDGSWNADVYQRLGAAMEAAGIPVTQANLTSLLQGRAITAAQTTLAARELGITAAGQISAQQLQRQAQDLQAKVEQAAATGRWDEVRTLQAQQLDLETKIAQAQATGQWTGATLTSQTLAQQAQDLQFKVEQAAATGKWDEVRTLQAQQLDLQQRAQTQAEVEGRAGQTGLYQDQVTLAKLGLAPSSSNQQIADAWKANTGKDITGAQLTALRANNGTGAATVDRQTLGARAQGLQNDIERGQLAVQEGNLELARSVEQNRRSEAIATMSGLVNREMNFSDFGLDIAAYWNPDGSVKPGMFVAAIDALDTMNSAAITTIGRALTQTEMNALIRGQNIKVGAVKTLAQQQLDLESAIQRADQTGLLWDPNTRQNVTTLRKQQQDNAKILADNTLAWQQKMDLAQQTGYVTAGTNGVLTAKDLGVDPLYVKDLQAADRNSSVEATRVKNLYKAMTGQDLTTQQLDSLLTGGSINVGRDIRVQTVVAKAQAEADNMRWSELSGKIGTQLTEAARQFNSELSRQNTLDASQIAQINANIALAQDQLANDMMQFASTSALNLMTLTGGGSGNMSSKQMGVDNSQYWDSNGNVKTGMFDQAINAEGALRSAFKTMTGRDPSPDEMRTLRSGGTTAIQGSQTLAARELAAQISAQTMEHEATMMKISNDYDISRDQLDQYVKESDRQWGLTAQESAQKYGLDTARFALAKNELDAKLTGKTNYSGQVRASDLGITVDPQSYAQMTNEQKSSVNNALIQGFKALNGGREPDANQMQALRNGSPVAVQSMSTLEAQQWAAQVAETARNHGLNEQQFTEAVRQFDANFALQDRNTWAQLTGNAVGLGAQGGVTGTTPYVTMDWRKYSDAKTALAESDAKNDLLWVNALGRFSGTKDYDFANASTYLVGSQDQQRGIMREQLRRTTEGAQVLPTMSDSDLDRLILQAKQQGKISVPNPTARTLNSEELSSLAALITGQAQAVALPSANSGLGGVLGAVVGTVAGSFLGGAGAQAGGNLGARLFG